MQASLRIMPGVITGTVGSLVSGIVIQKTGKHYWLTVAAYTLFTVSSVLLVLFMGPVVRSGIGLSIAFSLWYARTLCQGDDDADLVSQCAGKQFWRHHHFGQSSIYCRQKGSSYCHLLLLSLPLARGLAWTRDPCCAPPSNFARTAGGSAW